LIVIVTAHSLVYFAAMDFGKAFSSLGKAETQCEVGNAALSSGDYSTAVECFRECIAMDSTSKSYHLGLGMALEGVRDIDGAIASFRRCLEIDKKFLGAVQGLRRLGVEVDDGCSSSFDGMPVNVQAQIRNLVKMGVGPETIKNMFGCEPPS